MNESIYDDSNNPITEESVYNEIESVFDVIYNAKKSPDAESGEIKSPNDTYYVVYTNYTW